MYNKRSDNLKALGVDIKLTKQGVDILSRILSDGCPVKMEGDYYKPINCPLFRNVNNRITCKICWKKWLEYFMEGETNESANG